MSVDFLNRPDYACPISAEEYAASLGGADCGCGQGTGCGCGRDADCGGGCAPSGPCRSEQMVCCCRTVPAPAPAPVPEVDEGCCCKESFRAALEVLCDPELSSLLDFSQTAFLTDTFVAGTTLTVPSCKEKAPADDLDEELTGTFRRFSPCSRGLLDVDAVPYYPVPDSKDALPFTVDQVSLCALSALVIQARETDAEGEATADETAARQMRCIKRLISARLRPCSPACGESGCCCALDEECCCARGVLSALAGSNLSRRVTLTAGWLALNDVELLGTAGNVLVLASDETRRVYFVCASKVQFMA